MAFCANPTVHGEPLISEIVTEELITSTYEMPTLGSTLLRFDTVTSTNDVARDLAASGAAEGLGVIAREQTAGRGRHGRSWSSPPGEGLYLSLVLRPEFKASESAVITLAAAVGVAETLQRDYGVAADIKWPNDILASGRKICGILVEAAIESDRLQYAIVGIGVNIAQRFFHGEISQNATSLFLETGKVVAPDDFIKPLFKRLDYWYLVSASRSDQVLARWEQLSSYARDRAVRIEAPEGVTEGVTRGLTSGGALIIELDNGDYRTFVSGEVSLRAAAV